MKKVLMIAALLAVACTEPDTGTCDFIVKTTNFEYPNFGAYVDTVANEAACKHLCVWSRGGRACCHFHPFPDVSMTSVEMNATHVPWHTSGGYRSYCEGGNE